MPTALASQNNPKLSPATGLAVYAADPARAERRYVEPPPTSRTQFQRDRDRIIHCAAFRRLEYKTQVFVNHEGDLFRTRLTHSLEVAQIARSAARNLGLNEDLVEAISLAHDLGHTPFGHAGQDALNECMRENGGFEHNLQSLRVIDELEERYPAFNGLNLCFETREGVLKHCSAKNARLLGAIGERFLTRRQPSLEAQLANLADEIAYNNHDVDDGLRSGLLTIDELMQVGLFATHARQVEAQYPNLNPRRLVYETVRRMINYLVIDLVNTSRAHIAAAAPDSIAAVRALPPLIQFSPEAEQRAAELKRFLRDHLYHHYRVERMTAKARRVVRDLYQAFVENPRLLPSDDQARAEQDKHRAIADYVAGMTDRYAMREHRRLFAIEDL